jgi:hypothetical protein
MNKLSYAVRPALIAFLVLAMTTSPLAAQQDKQGKMGKNSMKDTNIKNDSDGNSPAVEGTANSQRAMRAKGGSTDGVCIVTIHNFTNLKVKIFVNGDYLALAAPYGNVTITADAGTPLVIYERADFIGGKEFRFWDKSTYPCESGIHIEENLN